VIAGARVNTPAQDEVINPASGAPFATCARAGLEHLDAAVGAADEAFRSWRRDDALRQAKLRECAAAIRARSGELARLLTQEQGRGLGGVVRLLRSVRRRAGSDSG
jgi:acyl-CoA reductase-like NAD-dependent aldehyde dehydrogenase